MASAAAHVLERRNMRGSDKLDSLAQLAQIMQPQRQTTYLRPQQGGQTKECQRRTPLQTTYVLEQRDTRDKDILDSRASATKL